MGDGEPTKANFLILFKLEFYDMIIFSYYCTIMDIEEENTNEASHIQLIEQNCEYFTVIRCSKYQKFYSQKTLNEYQVEKARLSYSDFIQLFTQSAYLILSSHTFALNIEIDPKDVKVEEVQKNENEKFFKIIIYYTLKKQSTGIEYINIITALFQYFLQFYTEYEKKYPGGSVNDPQKKSIERFLKQYGHLIAYYDSFKGKQKLFFMCLEETSLFREHSFLAKIKNKSLLNYLKPRMEEVKEAKKRDVSHTNEYIHEKKKVKVDIDNLKRKESEIEKNIINFFAKISEKQYFFIHDKDQSFKIKFVFKKKDVSPMPFNERLAKLFPNFPQLSEPTEKDVEGIIPEFQVEYSSEKNSICVKYIFQHLDSIYESSDFFSFLSSALSFQAHHSLDLEIVEVKETNEMKETSKLKKYLAFKGFSTFTSKEPALQKILLLMDLTMISACIVEPSIEEIREAFSKNEEYGNFSNVCKKINHYTKIYLKNAAKSLQ